MCTCLSSFRKLSHLVIDDHPLLSDGAIELSRLLPQLPCLTSIHLTATHIDAASSLHLGRAFAALPALQTLELASNILMDEGCGIIILSFPSKLRHLGLSRCRATVRTCRMLAGRLDEDAVWRDELRTLDLEGNALGGSGLYELCVRGFAGGLRSLGHLNLSGTCLSDVSLIAAYLRALPNLRVLNLSKNIIRDAYIKSLALAFKHLGCPFLEKLDISSNSLGANAIHFFCQSFRTSTCTPLLSTLDVSGNPLGDKGVGELALCLQGGHLPRLVVLGLSRCNVGNSGVMDLERAFRQRAFRSRGKKGLPYPEAIYLRENPSIGKNALAALQAAVETEAGHKHVLHWDGKTMGGRGGDEGYYSR